MAAAGTCAYLMCVLPGVTWLRFILWMAAGLAIYLSYGVHRSRLAAEGAASEVRA